MEHAAGNWQRRARARGASTRLRQDILGDARAPQPVEDGLVLHAAAARAHAPAPVSVNDAPTHARRALPPPQNRARARARPSRAPRAHSGRPRRPRARPRARRPSSARHARRAAAARAFSAIPCFSDAMPDDAYPSPRSTASPRPRAGAPHDAAREALRSSADIAAVDERRFRYPMFRYIQKYISAAAGAVAVAIGRKSDMAVARLAHGVGCAAVRGHGGRQRVASTMRAVVLAEPGPASSLRLMDVPIPVGCCARGPR